MTSETPYPDDNTEKAPVDPDKTFIEGEFVDPDLTMTNPLGNEILLPSSMELELGEGFDFEESEGKDKLPTEALDIRMRELRFFELPRFETIDRKLRKAGKPIDLKLHYFDVLTEFLKSPECAEVVLEKCLDPNAKVFDIMFIENGKCIGIKIKRKSIGKGGMGIVEQVTLFTGEDVAVKCPLPEVGSEFNHEALIRFRRETDLAIKFNGVLLMYPETLRHGDREIGDNKIPYIALKNLDSAATLDDVLKYGALPAAAVTDLLLALTVYLEVHAANNTINRDIKTKNIMIGPDGHIYMIDLGLGKEEGQEDVTKENYIVGTGTSMPPETFKKFDLKKPYDQYLADIYGLGTVGVAALTGKPAIRFENVGQLLTKHRDGNFRVDLQKWLTSKNPLERGVALVIEGMTEPHPDDRWGHARIITELFKLRIHADQHTELTFRKDKDSHKVMTPTRLIPTTSAASRVHESANKPSDFFHGIREMYEDQGDQLQISKQTVRKNLIRAGIGAGVLAVVYGGYELKQHFSAPKNVKSGVTEMDTKTFSTLEFNNDKVLFTQGEGSLPALAGIQFFQEGKGDPDQSFTYENSITGSHVLMNSDLVPEDIVKIFRESGAEDIPTPTFPAGRAPKFVVASLGEDVLYFIHGVEGLFVYVNKEEGRTHTFDSTDALGKYLKDNTDLTHLKALSFKDLYTSAKGDPIAESKADQLGRIPLPKHFAKALQMILEEQFAPIFAAAGIERQQQSH